MERKIITSSFRINSIPRIIKKMIKNSIENHPTKAISKNKVNKETQKNNQKRMPIHIKKVLRSNNKSQENKQK